jgi:hypothetical protein
MATTNRTATTSTTSRWAKLSPDQLADEAGWLHDQLDQVKDEAIRRGLHRAESADWRIALSPPGEQQRTDKPLLLRVLGIGAAEFAVRFCHPVRTDWRLTVTRRKQFQAAA